MSCSGTDCGISPCSSIRRRCPVLSFLHTFIKLNSKKNTGRWSTLDSVCPFDMRQSSLAERGRLAVQSIHRGSRDIFLEFIRLQSLENLTLGLDDEFLARILEAGEPLSLLDHRAGPFFS